MELPFEKVKREVIVKKELETNPEFGTIPEERPVAELLKSGIVNINKPKGPTSHQVADYVQKILGIKKAGHSGTLDPGVTGVLPVALGESTKIVSSLLVAGKEYVGTMHMHGEVDDARLKDKVERMTGKIKQLPPVKSAVKRELRERTIYYAKILERDGQEVLFVLGCQAGTYVRKWVHDLGSKASKGAHMSQLIRTKAGPFEKSTMITLQDLQDAMHYYKEGNEKLIRKCIMPVERGVDHLPKLWIADSAVDSICHGASLHVPGVAKFEDGIKEGDVIAVMTLKGELVMTAETKMSWEDLMTSERGVVARPTRVFMKTGVYPKIPVRAENDS